MIVLGTKIVNYQDYRNTSKTIWLPFVHLFFTEYHESCGKFLFKCLTRPVWLPTQLVSALIFK